MVRIDGLDDSALISRSLVELLPQHLPPALPMTVLYPRHRHLMLRLRLFIG